MYTFWAFFLFVLGVEITTDTIRIEISKKPIRHRLSAIFRGFALFGNALLLAPKGAKLHYFALECVIFWIVFELIINRLRDKPLLYVGSGEIDELFKEHFPQHPGRSMFIVKLIMLAISLASLLTTRTL